MTTKSGEVDTGGYSPFFFTTETLVGQLIGLLYNCTYTRLLSP